MTIFELRNAFCAKIDTPTDAVRRALEVISARDGEISAFIDVYKETALKAAVEATEAYKNSTDPNSLPPLLGVPLAIKNNILISGERATASSKILEEYHATYDATIIKKLREAGAIFIGSTNMDEFAMGGSTENSAFGPTKNPHDIKRVPGGSSGGSAAAVAMEAVPAAIGTDTGGSVRQPASYCGLVGYKPTYGAVSRYGLIAMGSSLDQAGPLTNSVADAELLHSIMAGEDTYDATTITPDTYGAIEKKEKYTIGIPREFLSTGIDADVLGVFEKQLEDLQADGHTIVDISLPMFEKGLAAYYIVMPAEVSSNLARFDGIRYGLSVEGDDLLAVYEQSRAKGFGAEVKRRILLGTYVLSSGYYDAYYGKAEEVRTLMREELAEIFKKVDLIMTPTAPTPAFKLGEQEDPLAMYRQDIFTVPVNLTGVPAISWPMGVVNHEGSQLPVGIQCIAPHGGDSRLFDAGKRLYDEKRTVS
ncbi:MAG: Asp-tRNA(Asn)/Glu-tRNA(Gln) amidotransferase subunit GatA [Candidatus Paceibacteria bacterium]